jgi:N6-adenosine-specific RNA methylase IME4
MKKYNVIYADPPWRYRNKPTGRSPEDHYPTMTMEEIAALPVKDLADENCVLFMWVTLPMLEGVWKIIKSWGFKYKTTAFVWIKLNPKNDGIFWGLGYWTRANVEICLLATKGKPRRRASNIHQVIISHVEEHSKKPEEARRRIEVLTGDVPKIELFARRYSPGWDVWGNEVESDVVM